MVLLSPSIAALRKLQSLCESYAVADKYNAKNSEYMIFKVGSKTYTDGVTGSHITEDLRGNCDIERERGHWQFAVKCYPVRSLGVRNQSKFHSSGHMPIIQHL